MSMFELTAILWRRRLLVLSLAVAVFVIGAAVVFATRSTSYTASSQVLFDQPGLEVSGNGAGEPSKISTLLPTFCALVGSDEAAAAAAAQAGVTSGVAASVSCTPEPNTLVVLLQLNSKNAATARRVVAAVAQELVSSVQQIYSPTGTPTSLRVTADIIQASHSTENSHGTARALGLVVVAAIIFAFAFALAVEPHRRDYNTLARIAEEHYAVQTSDD